MASLGELFVKIGIDATEFNRSITGMSKKLEEVGSKMKDVGGDMSTYITAPIVALGAGSIYAAGQMESLSNGLKAVMGSGEAAADELEQLKEVAKLPGLGLKEVVQGSIRLQTIGFSAEKARESMKAFGNAVATVGGGREQLEGALYGLQQLANTEFPLGEDLNIIKDAIPQVTPLLKEAFGTARTEELQKLGITSQMVVDTIITGLNKLPPVAGGVNNAFENLRDSGFNALATLGEGILDVLPIEGIMNKLGAALMGVANWFKELGPITKGIILTVVGLAAVAGPLLLVLGTMVSLLPTLAAGWVLLGNMFNFTAIKTKLVTAAQWLYNAALNANPIGLVVAAIGALVAAFVIAWENSEKFRGVIKGLWAALKQIGNNIISLFSGIGDLIGSVLSGEFSKIPDLVKKLSTSLLKGSGDAFGKAYEKEIKGKPKEAIKKVTEEDRPAIQEEGKKTGKAYAKGSIDGFEEEIKKLNESLQKVEIGSNEFRLLSLKIKEAKTELEFLQFQAEQELFVKKLELKLDTPKMVSALDKWNEKAIKKHEEREINTRNISLEEYEKTLKEQEQKAESVAKKIQRFLIFKTPIGNFTALYDKFKPVLEKIGKAITKVFDKVGDYAKKVVNGLKGLAAPITGGMESGGGALGALMEGNVIGALVSLFGDLAKESKGFAKLMEMINSVMSSVMTALAPAFDMLVTALHPLVGIIQSVMSTLGEMLISVLEPILPPLMQLLEIVAMLFEGLKPLVAAIGQLVGIILDVVIDLIEPLIEPLMGLFDMVTMIVQALGPLIRIIGDILTPIFEIIGAILESVIAPILAIVAEILKVLTPLLELMKLSLMTLNPILQSLALVFKSIEISLKPILVLFEGLGIVIQDFVDWIKGILEKFGVNTDKISQSASIGGASTTSFGSSTPTTDYSSYSSTPRDPIQVEGQLRVSGTDLVAVLNNTQKVRNFTT